MSNRALLVTRLASVPVFPQRVRDRLYRMLGVSARIGPSVSFARWQTTFGEGCYIGPHCYFEDNAPVSLGSRVWLAPGCRLLTATHEIGPPSQRAGTWRAEEIELGDGAWLGAGAIVLPGVRVGAGCVIAAGAVVTTDCEPNGLYAGVPAVRKRDLPA
jgi:acetyltransferase-like isoleucine patch superfamily enzyme